MDSVYGVSDIGHAPYPDRAVAPSRKDPSPAPSRATDRHAGVSTPCCAGVRGQRGGRRRKHRGDGHAPRRDRPGTLASDAERRDAHPRLRRGSRRRHKTRGAGLCGRGQRDGARRRYRRDDSAGSSRTSTSPVRSRAGSPPSPGHSAIPMPSRCSSSRPRSSPGRRFDCIAQHPCVPAGLAAPRLPRTRHPPAPRLLHRLRNAEPPPLLGSSGGLVDDLHHRPGVQRAGPARRADRAGPRARARAPAQSRGPRDRRRLARPHAGHQGARRARGRQFPDGRA